MEIIIRKLIRKKKEIIRLENEVVFFKYLINLI
jgi:hypothetical protein